ncbi:MAG TPA: decaprenylphosphoryl-beta-D-ribose oxidase [Actinobacteria bacterium]|nr:decaprenylphosphoryl-beta-D-ribose oxidase [Actinomycetota bacterium]
MEVVRRGSSRGVLARGLGRSYGDSAQNAGGEVLLMEHMASTHSFDPDTGILDVDAGASVDSIITEFLPRGWFVPVSPGTRAVTVGGAIAADVHGKNHHAVGSFGMHVRSLDLVAGDGTVRTLSPESTPDQFWATVGGMGLTGVIIRARVTLQKVPSSSLLVETQRCDGLDELMARQVELDQQHRYVVAWIDCLTKGPRLGRGVITAGDFAAVSALPAERAADPLAYEPGRKVPTPPFVPSGLLNRFSVAAFNEAWFRKAPRSKTDEIQSMATFFHPLDGVQGWNRLYGPAGFVQYQFVVPESGAEVVRTAIERLSAIGAASFLGVLKRFGDASPAPLSFPMPGWTLALDIPTGVVGLADTLDDLDELVAQAGGRIYLAKDSRLRPRWLPAMYPRLAEWRAVRDDMDPHGVFVSDQFRRLQP